MIQYQNSNLRIKFEPSMTSFFPISWLWRHYDDASKSKLVFRKNFGKHQPACQIWYSYYVEIYRRGGAFLPPHHVENALVK